MQSNASSLLQGEVEWMLFSMETHSVSTRKYNTSWLVSSFLSHFARGWIHVCGYSVCCIAALEETSYGLHRALCNLFAQLATCFISFTLAKSKIYFISALHLLSTETWLALTNLDPWAKPLPPPPSPTTKIQSLISNDLSVLRSMILAPRPRWPAWRTSVCP